MRISGEADFLITLEMLQVWSDTRSLKWLYEDDYDLADKHN